MRARTSASHFKIHARECVALTHMIFENAIQQTNHRHSALHTPATWPRGPACICVVHIIKISISSGGRKMRTSPAHMCTQKCQNAWAPERVEMCACACVSDGHAMETCRNASHHRQPPTSHVSRMRGGGRQHHRQHNPSFAVIFWACTQLHARLNC